MSQTANRSRKWDLLGEVLLSSGRITQEQLDKALALKRDRGLKLGQALVETGLITESELSEALGMQGKMVCINLLPEIIDAEAADFLGENLSRKYCAIAINRIAEVTTVAMADPMDIYCVDEIARNLKSEVLAVHAEQTKIEQCLDFVFGTRAEDADVLEELAGSLDIEDGDISFMTPTLEETGTDEAFDKPVVNMVRGLLKEACEIRASDIHLEPRRESFVARFRVDGCLQDRLSLGLAWARPCVARLKVLAQLDLAQSRLPQDGHTQAMVQGRPVDMRIATSPTIYGESAVIRILDSTRNLRDLASLELDDQQLEAVTRMTDCRDGLVLATGPTGSGKTTTLYALLQKINNNDIKIITLEDPVENQVDGISQINVHNKSGLTFAKGLRSILRQDPDVVLVGEMRDEETAHIAVQAALTGHTVLSTLHTVGTVETISRLADMGLEPYLLADTLRGLIAQRLIRRICVECKQPAKVDAKTLELLGLTKKDGPFYEGTGCSACRDTGYTGRMAIYEVLYMTPELCRMVQQGVNSKRLRSKVLKTGLHTLRMDAVRKVKAGVTTVSEALAATIRE